MHKSECTCMCIVFCTCVMYVENMQQDCLVYGQLGALVALVALVAYAN